MWGLHALSAEGWATVAGQARQFGIHLALGATDTTTNRLTTWPSNVGKTLG
jgi:hypothetical protein